MRIGIVRPFSCPSPCASADPTRRRHRGFTLVLTLLLCTLLLTTCASLVLASATHSAIVHRKGLTIDHELAVDSLLTCLPDLLRADATGTPQPGVHSQIKRVSLSFAGVNVECNVSSEQGKSVPPASNVGSGQTTISQLAQSKGLTVDSILLRPIVVEPERTRLGPYHWFDQVIRQQRMEEIFHWRLAPKDESLSTKLVWSDVLGFWPQGHGDLLALDVETVVNDDHRRWYLVVAVESAAVRVLHRSAI